MHTASSEHCGSDLEIYYIIPSASIAYDDKVQIHVLFAPSHATSVREERNSKCCRGSDGDERYLTDANLCKYNAPSPLNAVIYVRKVTAPAELLKYVLQYCVPSHCATEAESQHSGAVSESRRTC